MRLSRDTGIKTETQKLAADLRGHLSRLQFWEGPWQGSLIKAFIPVAGNVFNATVNTTVAATVTAVLGFFVVSIVCEQYLAACVDNNGAVNLPFTQFMNSARLKEAVKYVTEHKNEFNIQDLLTRLSRAGKPRRFRERTGGVTRGLNPKKVGKGGEKPPKSDPIPVGL